MSKGRTSPSAAGGEIKGTVAFRAAVFRHGVSFRVLDATVEESRGHTGVAGADSGDLVEDTGTRGVNITLGEARCVHCLSNSDGYQTVGQVMVMGASPGAQTRLAGRTNGSSRHCYPLADLSEFGSYPSGVSRRDSGPSERGDDSGDGAGPRPAGRAQLGDPTRSPRKGPGGPA